MRRETLYLADMIEAADHVESFVANLSLEDFAKSELIRSAVAQKLAVIGEAAARMPEDLRNRHPDVPWPQIVAFRNVLVHAYFGIDWEEVWRVARDRCPTLREQVAAIIQSLDETAP